MKIVFLLAKLGIQNSFTFYMLAGLHIACKIGLANHWIWNRFKLLKLMREMEQHA